jgi:flavodoxin
MKILIAFFSQTGNTEHIARAIHEELSGEHEVDTKPVEEVSADALAEYGLLFVGSPIHASGLASPVNELMQALPEGPGFKLAGFVTHASFAYEKQGFEAGVQSFEEICKQKNISYLGCFDCQGRLSPQLQPMVKEARGMSDEEWTERMVALDRHPDAEDEKNARKFAREAIASL